MVLVVVMNLVLCSCCVVECVIIVKWFYSNSFSSMIIIFSELLISEVMVSVISIIGMVRCVVMR